MEDTFQEGQEKEERQEKENIKAEDNAIEMTEDFDGQMHDGTDNEPGKLKWVWPVACTGCKPLLLSSQSLLQSQCGPDDPSNIHTQSLEQCDINLLTICCLFVR